MNNIAKVGETINARETMTSLDIADITGKRHSDVMRDIRALLEQGVDKRNFALTSYIDRSNRENPMFVLNKVGSLILASGYNAVLREAIIKRWAELELMEQEGLKMQQEQKFPIPQTYSEALQLAANQAKKIEEQTKQLEEQKPKVEFFDQVTDSKDALDMAVCAKTLNMGIGRNRLFEFLRTNAVLDSHNIPFQRYIDAGYFRTIEQKFSKPDGSTCINIKTVVYQSGMDFIRRLLTKKIN